MYFNDFIFALFLNCEDLANEFKISSCSCSNNQSPFCLNLALFTGMVQKLVSYVQKSTGRKA